MQTAGGAYSGGQEPLTAAAASTHRGGCPDSVADGHGNISWSTSSLPSAPPCSIATPRRIPEFPAAPLSPVLSTFSSTTRSASPGYECRASFQSLELVNDFQNLDVSRRMSSSPPPTPSLPMPAYLPPTVPYYVDGDFASVADADEPLQVVSGSRDHGLPAGEPSGAQDREGEHETESESEAQTCTVDGESFAASPNDASGGMSENGEWDGHPTDCDGLPDEAIDSILACTLRRAYGVDLHDVSLPRDYRRRLVADFIHSLSAALGSLSPKEAEEGPLVRPAQAQGSTPSGAGQNAYSQQGGHGTQGSQQQPQHDNRKGKRKKDDFEADQDWGRDGQDRDEAGAPKRTKESRKQLRLSCPFRKRNPCRFNCRDYHSCSFTYFTSFSDLKQHLVGPQAKHTLKDDTAYACLRCNDSFSSRQDLEAHLKVPVDQMCQSKEHDPEDGVDNLTAATILSRKFQGQVSIDHQWAMLWKLLFPKDKKPKLPDFHPPIEHFEFAEAYKTQLPEIYPRLQPIGWEQPALETLAGKFLDHFMSVMENYNDRSREMEYFNRQGNKRSAVVRRSAQMQVDAIAAKSNTLRDSGIAFDVEQPHLANPRAGPNSNIAFTIDGTDAPPPLPPGLIVRSQHQAASSRFSADLWSGGADVGGAQPLMNLVHAAATQYAPVVVPPPARETTARMIPGTAITPGLPMSVPGQIRPPPPSSTSSSSMPGGGGGTAGFEFQPYLNHAAQATYMVHQGFPGHIVAPMSAAAVGNDVGPPPNGGCDYMDDPYEPCGQAMPPFNNTI